MKKLLVCFLMLFCIVPSFADDVQIPVSTSTESGRFEFIQSTIARRISFMLDKYTGRVWQMVQISKQGEIGFAPIPKDIPSTDAKSEKINYQLYMSGTALKDCFLLNINTGEVWQLVEDKDEELLFQRIQGRLDYDL
jgi:hypothetical protein